MQWIGWIVFAVILIVSLGIYQTGRRDLALEQQRIEREIRVQRNQVETILNQAEKAVPELEIKLRNETTKRDKLEADKRRFQEKRAATEERIADLERAIAQAREARDKARGARRDNLAEISDLQKQIAGLEKEIALMYKALDSVTPKAGI